MILIFYIIFRFFVYNNKVIIYFLIMFFFLIHIFDLFLSNIISNNNQLKTKNIISTLLLALR